MFSTVLRYKTKKCEILENLRNFCAEQNVFTRHVWGSEARRKAWRIFEHKFNQQYYTKICLAYFIALFSDYILYCDDNYLDSTEAHVSALCRDNNYYKKNFPALRLFFYLIWCEFLCEHKKTLKIPWLMYCVIYFSDFRFSDA